jgi:Fe-S-cluster containining protein
MDAAGREKGARRGRDGTPLSPAGVESAVSADASPADGQNASDEPADGRRVEVHPGREAVVEFDPERTFECVDSCTWCCHHGVLLYPDDLHELAAREDLSEATTTHRGQRFVPREAKGRDEHADADGAACRFLEEDGRCGLHAEHDWKPTRCSVFPLAVAVEDGELHVSVREDAELHCEGLGVSERRLIDHLDAFLPETLWELDHPETRVAL